MNIKELHNPKPVTLIWCEPGRRYALADFTHYAAPTTRENKPRMAPNPVDYGVLGGTKYGRVALLNELAKLAQEGEGHRNTQLNRTAYTLGRLVGAGQLDRQVVEAHLFTVGLNLGLSERETLATINSGLNAGLNNPRCIDGR